MPLSIRDFPRPIRRAPYIAAPGISKFCKKFLARGFLLHEPIQSENSDGAFPIKLRCFERDTTIFEAGETPGIFGVLKSGYLRIERTYGNGRRTIFGLLRPGEIVGNMPGQPSEVSVAAATDVEICCFDDENAIELMETNSQFRMDFLNQATAMRDRQCEMIWQRGALNSRERVIGILIMMADYMPGEPLPDGGIIVSIDLSRQDWADMTNTTMETISRTMTSLSRMGLVETVAPRRYKISDLGQLARMAGKNEPVRRPRGSARSLSS